VVDSELPVGQATNLFQPELREQRGNKSKRICDSSIDACKSTPSLATPSLVDIPPIPRLFAAENSIFVNIENVFHVDVDFYFDI
jgi:hypothetical protein